MITNILEYLLTDAYLLLWLGAAGDTTKTVFDPALVAQLDPEELPQSISVKGFFSRRTATAGATMRFDEMTLIWSHDQIEGRPKGPYKVVLTNVTKWHRNGLLHGTPAASCETAKFVWGDNNRSYRDDGPYTVTLRKIECPMDRGKMRFPPMVGGVSMEWNDSRGRRLGQTRMEEIILQNQLRVNPFHPVKFFTSPEDEIIFMTELT